MKSNKIMTVLAITIVVALASPSLTVSVVGLVGAGFGRILTIGTNRRFENEGREKVDPDLATLAWFISTVSMALAAQILLPFGLMGLLIAAALTAGSLLSDRIVFPTFGKHPVAYIGRTTIMTVLAIPSGLAFPYLAVRLCGVAKSLLLETNRKKVATTDVKITS